ncbi:uncharacterized protein V6R79_001515 [Siganus canaliculatus]
MSRPDGRKETGLSDKQVKEPEGLCEMSHIPFLAKWAEQEPFPTLRSTVIAGCCLTVNRAVAYSCIVDPIQHPKGKKRSKTPAEMPLTQSSVCRVISYVFLSGRCSMSDLHCSSDFLQQQQPEDVQHKQLMQLKPQGSFHFAAVVHEAKGLEASLCMETILTTDT